LKTCLCVLFTCFTHESIPWVTTPPRGTLSGICWAHHSPGREFAHRLVNRGRTLFGG
jgi:hypothetical protein